MPSLTWFKSRTKGHHRLTKQMLTTIGTSSNQNKCFNSESIHQLNNRHSILYAITKLIIHRMLTKSTIRMQLRLKRYSNQLSKEERIERRSSSSKRPIAQLHREIKRVKESENRIYSNGNLIREMLSTRSSMLEWTMVDSILTSPLPIKAARGCRRTATKQRLKE